MKRVVICDANILIDYAKASKDIIGLITEHLYEIWVPLPVWGEIQDLSDDDATTLGINIFEPSLAQTYEAADMHGGGLSDEDNMCFIVARDEEAICATNEKPLRKKCIESGIEVLWGLQIMGQLCEEGKLTVKSAEKVARKIAQDNRTITDEIINRFINNINDRGGRK
jgi:rRNA-processing protein FCF1